METDEEIISRLKFLALIGKETKIDIKSMTLLPCDSFIRRLKTAFCRTVLYQDDRENTLKFVRQIITDAQQLISRYLVSNIPSEKFMCPNILIDLKQSKVGLNNLKLTYSEKTKFCCDIDTILGRLEAFLAGIDPSTIQAVESKKKTMDKKTRVG